MSDFLRAVTLAHQAAKPRKRGKLLRMYRAECADAAAIRRKRQPYVADKILKRAQAKLFQQLFGRHGTSRVWKHAHTIRAVLERVQRREEDELYESDSHRNTYT